MQWRSIESAWNLMEETMKSTGKDYKRVAFMRSDVLYATPIDIFEADFLLSDKNNELAIIPGFAKHPVNDRMIYGPINAVRIWATERFHLLEEYVKYHAEDGYGMHPERFLNHSIFPRISSETGVEVFENVDICFYRVRAGDSLVISDCDDKDGGSTRGIELVDEQDRIENIIDRLCALYDFPDLRFQELRCGSEVEPTEIIRRHLARTTKVPGGGGGGGSGGGGGGGKQKKKKNKKSGK
jgi:hypothetical protein